MDPSWANVIFAILCLQYHSSYLYGFPKAKIFLFLDDQMDDKNN